MTRDADPLAKAEREARVDAIIAACTPQQRRQIQRLLDRAAEIELLGDQFAHRQLPHDVRPSRVVRALHLLGQTVTEEQVRAAMLPAPPPPPPEPPPAPKPVAAEPIPEPTGDQLSDPVPLLDLLARPLRTDSDRRIQQIRNEAQQHES